ncbi:MAG: sugar phosphate isomerase/epimerase family protein [Gemmataceae bacterium]
MLRLDPTRRGFLAAGLALAAAPRLLARTADEPLFKISLAQWSYNKAFFSRKKDPLRFAEIAKKDHGIEAIEYVNQFYATKKSDGAYLMDLKKIADDNGVRSVLIMCDNEGKLGDPDEKKRTKAVNDHKRWVEWAKFLGCHSIRVNAYSSGTPDEQRSRVVDGLSKLSEIAAKMSINVIVENHGGLSSNGEWLASVMKAVNLPNCGTLPDFGNFYEYDRYKGVDEMMPYAKGASAKSYDFDSKGNETKVDYRKMLDIVVKKHNYHGYMGIEYEGSKLSEAEGVAATKKLLETIRTEMSKAN